MTRLLTVCAVLMTAASAFASDEVPGKASDKPTAVVGVTVHGPDGAAENQTVLIKDGLISAIGEEAAGEDAETIDGAGLHLYPALFEAYSQMGLVEISSVRASNDYDEAGLVNPNVRADKAINPDSEIIPVTRSNGVLLAMTCPTGGLISGQTAVLQLDGWTTEDMTLLPRAAMVVNLRSAANAERLEEMFAEARRYEAAQKAGEEPRHDLRLEALLPILNGQQPVIIRADRWQSITGAVAFAQKNGLKLIILGGYDAPRCAALLKKYDVPVILSAVHRQPIYRHDAYDAAYTLPQRLQELGIRYCICGYDRSETWNTRNLPYHAATAAAYGLDVDEALRAITLYPAQILGVADKVGSLEVGKQATMILTTGNPLEAATEVKAAWVQGRPVDLDDKQKALYRKYQQKYAD